MKCQRPIEVRQPFVRSLLVVVLAATASLCAQSLRGQNPYTIRRIAPIAPSLGGYATAISEKRVVVGTAGTVTGYVMSAGSIAALPDGLGGFQSMAYGIGPTNQVLGSAVGSSGWEEAAVWTPGSNGLTLTLLPPAPGDQFANARAMGASGLIAGISDDGLLQKAAVWQPAGTAAAATLLPLLPGAFEGAALDVDASNCVVGWSAQFGSVTATRWHSTGGIWTTSALPGLGGGSLAVAIDAIGRICGSSQQPGGGWKMVCWPNATTVVDLGRWANTNTFATAMNSDGDVVGYADTGGMREAVARFGGTGTTAPVVDLASLLPPQTPWQRLWAANDINDHGDIVGYGEIAGFLHSFVMTPVDQHLTVGPGAAGVVNTYSVIDASPGEVVLFLVAIKGGEVLLSGHTQSLDLATPSMLGIDIADATGAASCSLFVPDHLLGSTFLHQTCEPVTGKVSDVRVVTY